MHRLTSPAISPSSRVCISLFDSITYRSAEKIDMVGQQLFDILKRAANKDITDACKKRTPEILLTDSKKFFRRIRIYTVMLSTKNNRKSSPYISTTVVRYTLKLSYSTTIHARKRKILYIMVVNKKYAHHYISLYNIVRI